MALIPFVLFTLSAVQPLVFCIEQPLDVIVKDLVNEVRLLKDASVKQESTIREQKRELIALKDKLERLEMWTTDEGKNMTNGQTVRSSRFVLNGDYENVAFCAYLDHRNLHLGPNQPIVFNKVLLNEGNAYNNNSGMFTAPVSGIYIFSFAVTCTRFTGEPAEEIRVKLVVNNTHQLTAIAQSNIEYDDSQGGNTAVLNVNQGDVVWIGHHSNIGDNLFSNDDLRVTSFTGALLAVA